MAEATPQPEKKSATVSPEQIARFLEKTGFVFEMRANELLLKAKYDTEINDEFLDLEGDTAREIDIIANKVINEINVHFIIECKQSLTDKWIFICNKSMPRYYRALKHLPSIPLETLKEKKVFSAFHVFDLKMPLAHNYLCFTIKGDKKAEHLQIDECVHKLPKALLDLASRAEGGRHLFFPVALFSGQMFSVSYPGKLVVTEVPFLQNYVEFDAEIYRREPEREAVPLERLLKPIFAELEQWSKKNRAEKIRLAVKELSSHYQIDFVTETGLPDYLTLIEKQVSAVRTADWPLPEPPKTEAVKAAN